MTQYYKYPRSFHLPWSRSYTHDDKVLKDVQHFIGKEVVVTEKLDGEGSTLYRDHMHARSINSGNHESRHWLKQYHSTFANDIPDNWRICGENLFAKHSIAYSELTSYFYAFSVWNDKNECLSWDETEEWCSLLGIETVPVLYRGIFDEKKIHEVYTKVSKVGGEQEGYVIRLADSFHYDNFSASLAKFVRSNHVQTDTHWMHQEVTPNRLK
ncbi:2'-5' RNA ligase [Priestia megaterium]|nr:2'-5' RNA ligase [Priestia megaterium]